MSVDQALLLGRIAFLAALYLFLFLLAILLWRELTSRASPREERAPADLLVVEPFEANLDTGERIPLLGLSSIGRGPDNDIIIRDTFVSTDHARLSWNGRGWVLEDVGSTNGTFVNGKQVSKRTAVKPGDVLEFGRVKVKLVPI